MIQMNIEKLGNHLNAYLTYHEKLGNSISTVVNQYNVTNKEFKKIDKDITKLTSSRSTIGIETENIEKPLVEKILDELNDKIEAAIIHNNDDSTILSLLILILGL